MTKPAHTDVDPWLAFTAVLAPVIVARLHRNQPLEQAVTIAMANGWTARQLADLATEGLPAHADVAAVVAARLLRAAGDAPPVAVPPAVKRQALPWCGQCDDPHSRWRTVAPGKVERCPDCWTPPPGYRPRVCVICGAPTTARNNYGQPVCGRHC